MSTKDRILEEALTLFAENGYDGTGVEQIAEKVGIKAPSLYKHFKGKEDIMTALIDSAEERYVRATMGRIAFTMHDPMIRKIRKFLVQEQFRNERLAEITTRHQLVGIQKMYEKIIEGMMKNGLFIHDDPALLSIELVSPVVLWVSKADRQPQYEQEIMEQYEQEIMDSIEKHIRHFCDVYMKDK